MGVAVFICIVIRAGTKIEEGIKYKNKRYKAKKGKNRRNIGIEKGWFVNRYG